MEKMTCQVFALNFRNYEIKEQLQKDCKNSV